MNVKTVHVAVYDGMADWEVGLATAHINNGYWQRKPGCCQVVTVGEAHDPVTTMGGLRVLPEIVLDQLRPADSTMLILPGSEIWLNGGNLAFAKKAREFLEAGVAVAAICGATSGLAVEGLLDHRWHTSNSAEFLAATGYSGRGHYCDDPAVTDGDLVTASGAAPVEFAREVLTRLELYEPRVLQSWYRLYGLNDPTAYTELSALQPS